MCHSMQMEISSGTIGRLEALLSAVLSAYMFYVIKSSSHTVAQLAVIRGILNVLIGAVHAHITGTSLFGDWRSLQLSLTRGTFGIVTNGLMMVSNKLLNISVYSVLSRMN